MQARVDRKDNLPREEKTSEDVAAFDAKNPKGGVFAWLSGPENKASAWVDVIPSIYSKVFFVKEPSRERRNVSMNLHAVMSNAPIKVMEVADCQVADIIKMNTSGERILIIIGSKAFANCTFTNNSCKFLHFAPFGPIDYWFTPEASKLLDSSSLGRIQYRVHALDFPKFLVEDTGTIDKYFCNASKFDKSLLIQMQLPEWDGKIAKGQKVAIVGKKGKSNALHILFDARDHLKWSQVVVHDDDFFNITSDGECFDGEWDSVDRKLADPDRIVTIDDYEHFGSETELFKHVFSAKSAVVFTASRPAPLADITLTLKDGYKASVSGAKGVWFAPREWEYVPSEKAPADLLDE